MRLIVRVARWPIAAFTVVAVEGSILIVCKLGKLPILQPCERRLIRLDEEVLIVVFAGQGQGGQSQVGLHHVDSIDEGAEVVVRDELPAQEVHASWGVP